MKIIDHPIIEDILAQAREHTTPPAAFRSGIRRIAGLLLFEALKQVPQCNVTIETPLEQIQVKRLKHPITLVPILRAGLGMVDGMLDLLPDAKVGHLGLYRDEATLQPVAYYQKLPTDIANGPVVLVDPMLATGGSALAAIEILKEKQCKDIRMVCLVAAPEGVERLENAVPDVPITAAALDRQLNDVGYILPGLGDAGDRLFGTH